MKGNHQLLLFHSAYDEHHIKKALKSNQIEETVTFGDTLRLCRFIRGDINSNCMDALIKAYNVTIVGPRHRAFADANALKDILCKMLPEKTKDIVKYLFAFFNPRAKILAPDHIPKLVVKVSLKGSKAIKKTRIVPSIDEAEPEPPKKKK